MISIDDATRDWQEMAAPVEPLSNTTRRYPRGLDEAFPVCNDGITFYPSASTLGHDVLYFVEAVILVGLCVWIARGFV